MNFEKRRLESREIRNPWNKNCEKQNGDCIERDKYKKLRCDFLPNWDDILRSYLGMRGSVKLAVNLFNYFTLQSKWNHWVIILQITLVFNKKKLLFF